VRELVQDEVPALRLPRPLLLHVAQPEVDELDGRLVVREVATCHFATSSTTESVTVEIRLGGISVLYISVRCAWQVVGHGRKGVRPDSC